MKIFVIGTRGIPNIPGGVERHCEELYPRIAALGHDVTVSTRTPYLDEKRQSWKGVSLSNIYSPAKKSLEAIVHTFLALIRARWQSPDVVHIHSIGPAILVPFARLLGLKVVVTNHGPDYDRQKWGRLAKFVLRSGEKLGGIFAHEVIVISKVIQEIVAKRCGRSSNLIYNGVPLPEKCICPSYLTSKSIVPGGYILAVARFVPEKGLHDLIEAFEQLDDTQLQLVIAGDADHVTAYSRKIKESAVADDRIILTGYISGAELMQIQGHARLFVLPSYHEGLPIALLEAMSYGIPLVVSDIPANIEVGLMAENYFKVGDVEDLKSKIKQALLVERTDYDWLGMRTLVGERYDWDDIAKATLSVYEQVVRR